MSRTLIGAAFWSKLRHLSGAIMLYRLNSCFQHPDGFNELRNSLRFVGRKHGISSANRLRKLLYLFVKSCHERALRRTLIQFNVSRFDE